MAIQAPDISIIGQITFGGTTVSQSFSSGSSDYNGTPFVYSCTFDIATQAGAYPYPAYDGNVYNAYTIAPGYKFALPSGKVYDVVTVNTTSTTNATIGLRDTDLNIFINSQQNPPDNAPNEVQYGVFFPIISGSVQLSNLQQNVANFSLASYWISDL